MKLLIVCLFLTYCACDRRKSSDDVYNYEFGVDIGPVVFMTTGSIKPYENLKTVPVYVSECYELKYVRVSVNNHYSAPDVDFDWNLKKVYISYSPQLYSSSKYTIIAKAVRSFCRSAEPEAVDQAEIADII